MGYSGAIDDTCDCIFACFIKIKTGEKEEFEDAGWIMVLENAETKEVKFTTNGSTTNVKLNEKIQSQRQTERVSLWEEEK